MKRIILNSVYIFLFLLSLDACNQTGSTNTTLPSTPFPSLPNYILSDFNLNQHYQYWEIRQKSINAATAPYSTLFSYDDQSLNTLTSTQLSALDSATSYTGFFSNCSPGYCPVYGVAILDNNINLQTTLTQLLTFFDTIDTIAELHIWLWANHYMPTAYKEVDSGYMVIAGWDNLCGTRGKDLQFIDYKGTITKLKTISTESYNACV